MGRITVGAIIMVGTLFVAVLISARYLPVYYNPASLQVVGEKSAAISAPAWAVFSLQSGDILFAENEEAVLPIASVTKLATAATLLENYDMFYTTTTSWRDVASEGRAGGLVPGDVLSRGQLLFPLLLESSNDAATTLESSLSAGELVESMNSFAIKHGLTDTTFSDPSGLSPENKSSVRDLVRMTYLINKEQPHVTDITRLKQYLIDKHGWQNNNPFVTHAGYAGGKHGFTSEAGRTAVAIFEEQFPKNQKVEIGYILLGSTDLKEDMAILRELVRTGVYYR
jgi:D-alanyl-D-alanine carboxypeptidase